MKKRQLIESIPNFSEGRDLYKVERLVSAYRAKPGIRLLDYTTDAEHNRCVVTVVGEPEPLRIASLEAIRIAQEIIDMNNHVGKHPRIGCVDVMPFVPVRNATLEEADQLAKAVAREAAEKYHQPIYLYEKSASAPHRADIAAIRKGQFEGLAEKMRDPMWIPDYGPAAPHPTGGATIIGARMPVIYYNISLATSNLEIARDIARRVRNVDGGLRYVKAMGILSEEPGQTQVTMNLTDFTRSAMHTAFQLVKMEAAHYGVLVTGSEIVGYVPSQALINTAAYYLQMDSLAPEQVLENNFDLEI